MEDEDCGDGCSLCEDIRHNEKYIEERFLPYKQKHCEDYYRPIKIYIKE
jgi:hypothetical protein